MTEILTQHGLQALISLRDRGARDQYQLHRKMLASSHRWFPYRRSGLQMTGAELNQARIALNLSRRAISELTGLHPDSIRYWESKSIVDTRGYAPKLIITALGLQIPEPLLAKRSRSYGVSVNFPTQPRVRHGEIHRCGAKTRKGTPCQCKPMPNKRRCKYHGGASTGSKTLEGRQRQSEAQKRRWARWRTESAPSHSDNQCNPDKIQRIKIYAGGLNITED